MENDFKIGDAVRQYGYPEIGIITSIVPGSAGGIRSLYVKFPWNQHSVNMLVREVHKVKVSEQEDIKRQEKRDLRRTLVTKGAFHLMCCILFLPLVTLGFIITSVVAFIWTLLKGDTNNHLYHFYQK